MSIFRFNSARLHSGSDSKYFIDCDFLTDEDITVIACRLADLVPPFSSVEGILQGGLRLAEAMKTHYAIGEGGHLIVDDVWTTGASMRDARETAKYRTGGGPVYGAVIFHRDKQSSIPHWLQVFGFIDLC